jgi:hypothetical protein
MNTPFGVPWERLELDDVRRFLGEGPDESLTWEAKGGDIRPEHVRRAVCAFANSELGGFLVLGVSREGPERAWRIGGWIPRDEPALWIGNSLAFGGVLPPPAVDIRVWRIDRGPEYVAVVAVDPASVPPAITSHGEVWQRVSGASKRIAEPADLRQLFERGRAAERRAEATALSGLKLVAGVDPAQRPTAYAVSLATPVLPSDVSLRLFRASLADAFTEVLRSTLRGEYLDARFNRHRLSVDRYGLSGTSASTFGNGAEGFSLWITRDGGFAGSRADPDLSGEGLAVVGGDPARLVPIWTALVRFAKEVGARDKSPAFVAIWLSDKKGNPLTIRRWTVLAAPTDDDLGSISREARRAAGQTAWEREGTAGA